MTEGRIRRTGSLRRRVLIGGLGATLVMLSGTAALVGLNVRAGRALASATDALITEQEIADRINEGVMRQLAALAGLTPEEVRATRAAFDSAGAAVRDQIALYRQGALTAEQRVELEEMREMHQRFEVTAVRAIDLVGRLEIQAARDALASTTEYAEAFLGTVSAFLATRQEDLRALRAEQDRSFRALYLGGAALALLVLISSLWVARGFRRRIDRPLEELTSAADRMGRGDLSARVSGGYDAELHGLAEGFNRMALNLETARENLERRNEDLTVALEQVRSAQAELIRSEKLSAIGRMTAGFAHELNNPLTSVLGYSQLLADRLREGDASEAEIDGLLGPLLQEAERAQLLVRNLLRTSRRAGEELVAVAPSEAVDVVVGLRRYAFEQAGLTLEVGSMPDQPVLAEPQRLQGCILNVVNNAFDAMREKAKGRLVVHGRSAGGWVDLVFDDEGPGLEEPGRVFEPFYTTKPVGEGTGLGLALVHQTMTSFGGSAHAENRTAGGSRFVLRFLAAESADDSVPVAETDTPDAGDAVAERPGPPSADSESPAGPLRILVVEDEDFLRSLHAKILARIHAEVFLTASVAEARQVLTDHEVDVIVSDVKMPDESGLDLYRWIQREHPNLVERFLFVSGDVSLPELADLSQRHPERFVHKPFDMHDYLARVQATAS